MHCSRCHTVNGDGGAIGPELNGAVPTVRLREDDWLQRWIDDPSRLLETARMPRLNPSLPERARVIDAIIGYLHVMADAASAKESPGER